MKKTYFALVSMMLLAGCSQNSAQENMTNWKTFESNDNLWKISFRYPEEYIAEISQHETGTIRIYTGEESLYRIDIGSCANSPENPQKNIAFKKIYINGRLFYKAIDPSSHDDYIYLYKYLNPSDETCVSFDSASNEKKALEILEKIVESVEFN